MMEAPAWGSANTGRAGDGRATGVHYHRSADSTLCAPRRSTSSSRSPSGFAGEPPSTKSSLTVLTPSRHSCYRPARPCAIKRSVIDGVAPALQAAERRGARRMSPPRALLIGSANQASWQSRVPCILSAQSRCLSSHASCFCAAACAAAISSICVSHSWCASCFATPSGW